MGFTFRKSFKIGKLINVSVSKSGVNVSAGVKGFKVGTGPKGNYVSMSKDGIGYKKYFGGKKKTTSTSKKKTTSKTSTSTATTTTAKNVADISTYNTENVVDSSSRELIETIRANRKKLFGKKTPIYYEVDEETESRLESFYESFAELEDCEEIWYVFGKDKSMANNYHNVDSKSIIRQPITIKYGVPNFIKTNAVVPCINAGDQELYFFPDRVIVAEGKKVGALSYKNLNIEVEHGRFKEEGQKPSDAKVIETTYKYTNKNGEPDKRYSYNPKTSIMEYTFIYFLGSKGFSECIMLSKNDVGEKLKFEIGKLKSAVNFSENRDDDVQISHNDTITSNDENRSSASETPQRDNAEIEDIMPEEEIKESNMFYKK